MKSRWIIWNEKEVLYQDFTGCGTDLEALRRELAEVDAVIVNRPRGSVIALADVTGTIATAAAVQLFKESASQTKPFISRQALLGVHGLKKYLAQAVSQFSGQHMKVCDTREQALDWLVTGD